MKYLLMRSNWIIFNLKLNWIMVHNLCNPHSPLHMQSFTYSHRIIRYSRKAHLMAFVWSLHIGLPILSEFFTAIGQLVKYVNHCAILLSQLMLIVRDIFRKILFGKHLRLHFICWAQFCLWDLCAHNTMI